MAQEGKENSAEFIAEEPKKKRGRPKKTTSTKVLDDKKAKIVRDQKGDDHFVVIEEKEYFTVTNRQPGEFHFKREDGKEDFFKGYETKDDITKKEKDFLLKTKNFEYGWIIFEEDDVDVSDEEIYNKNALTDSRMDQLIQKHKNDINYLQKFVDGMTSEFAIKILKDKFLKADMPGSLVVYCDYRLNQLEEEERERMKAPIDKLPDGV